MEINKDIALKKLGDRVRAIRRKKGFTQFELASFVYKDQQSIQRLEAGRVNPSYIYLLEICEGLDIEMKELLSEEDNRKH